LTVPLTKGKKAVTTAAVTTTKLAVAVANIAKELGREEVATSSDLAGQTANKSSMDMLAAFNFSILAAKKEE
jgi:hypothetical protein